MLRVKEWKTNTVPAKISTSPRYLTVCSGKVWRSQSKLDKRICHTTHPVTLCVKEFIWFWLWFEREKHGMWICRIWFQWKSTLVFLELSKVEIFLSFCYGCGLWIVSQTYLLVVERGWNYPWCNMHLFLSKLRYFHFHLVMVGVRKIFSLSVDQELGLWAWPRDTDWRWSGGIMPESRLSILHHL